MYDNSKDGLGNPYGYSLATQIPLEDDRQALWRDQRAARGFDDTELWNMDTTLARFLLPRLKAGREFYDGVSEHDMDIIIDGLEIMTSNDYFVMSAEQEDLVQSAKQRLYENLSSMWV